MKILLDFLPIILFFIAYKMGDIYLATTMAIFTSLIQNLWTKIKRKRFDKAQLLTLGMLTFLGGATLIFKNELFIKWKPTALYWAFALGFLLSQIFSQKPIIQRIGEQHLQLPTVVWKKLNLSWVLFFTLLGFINLYVVHYFSTDTWVYFKLFGILGLMLVFLILQALFVARYMATHKSRENGDSG